MDRLLWLVVGFVAGSVGGAVANEAISRCGCVGASPGDQNGAMGMLEGELADLELAARKALQHAEQFGYDTLTDAQLLAINAWDRVEHGLEKVWAH